MPLNLNTVKSAEPRERDYKLFDEKGLFLLVKANGAKYWRLKYRFGGREKLLALGTISDITLTQARAKRDDARTHLRDGLDPAETMKAKKQGNVRNPSDCFEAVTREWLEKRGRMSESGDKRLVRLFERDLFPALGRAKVGEISSPQLLEVLRKIEGRGAVETAHRAKQACGQVFRYAMAAGKATADPSAPLARALATPKAGHFSAITDPKEVGKLMLAIDVYQGTPIVKAALKLTALFFCRQGELRHMEWDEIKWDENRIEIPPSRMKGGEPHIIPLSVQARAILEELRDFHRRGKYVFPSARGASRPLSENGARVALRSMGYDNDTMTPHGFRAMARTPLDEVLEYRIEWIEQQLAHAVRDVHGRAYNRTKHLDKRAEMMQGWADYLDELKEHASEKLDGKTRSAQSK